MKVAVASRLLAAVTFLVASGVGARAIAAPSSVVIGGRITFRDATREARAEEVERLRWGHIVVEIRNGWQVFSARPDASGLFAITGPPGTYRLEYIRVGQLAEFVVPHEAVVASGGFTCLGTIVVQVHDITQDLGNNTTSTLTVRDDCEAIGPDLGRLADAANPGGGASMVRASPLHPVPEPTRLPHPMEVLVGFRADVGFASTGGGSVGTSSLRADFVLPIGRGNSVGQWLVGATLTRVGADFTADRWMPPPLGSQAVQTVWGGAVGAGHELWVFEAMAWGGAIGDPGRGAHGPFVGGSLRFGSFTWGFGGRMDYYPGTGDSVGSFMIDISPFAILGHLL
jgi:hypothetical protein